MAMIEINTNPTRWELRVFGLLVLIFLAVLGGLVVWKHEALIGAATFLTVVWLASLLFNAADRRLQLRGALLPALFATPIGALRLGLQPVAVALALAALGVTGAALIWLWPAGARRFYVLWMYAAAPIGWTVSHVILAIVYYGVVTPLGVVLRLAAYDPMKRAFDRSATSYWIKRETGGATSRYFRQF
jgi:hypothetical protein